MSLLGMKKVLLVSQSPNKSNIFYCLDSHQNDIEEVFAALVTELKQERTSTDKTIIVTHTTVVLVFTTISKPALEKIYPA